MVKAKKYSLALTDKGEVYIWGLKTGFGAPKKVASESEGALSIVDACLSNDKCYTLTSEGALYEWNMLNGFEKDGIWVCSAEKIMSDNRPILGFSAGDGYLLIVGDIKQQIEPR